MGEDLEKQTATALGNQKGEIPTTLRLLAISLDKTFEEIKAESAHRHAEILESLKVNKQHIDANCLKCKLEVDKKFDTLKILLFFFENPKVLYSGITILLFVLMLAGFGGKDLIEMIDKIK